MAILKIRDAEGNVQEIPIIKGDKGDAYVLTEADKQEIADLINASQGDVDLSNYFTKEEILLLANSLVSKDFLSECKYRTEEQVIALIQAYMPTSAEGVDY